MDSEIIRIAHAALSVRSEAEILDAMKRFGGLLGFDQVLFGIHVQMPLMAPLRRVVSGFPLAYQERYARLNYAERDPTVRHVLTRTDPLPWRKIEYDQSSYEILEESRLAGLRDGVCMSVHHGDRAVSILTLARDQPVNPREEARIIERGSVLAASLHVAAEGFIVPEMKAKLVPRLSPREKECLRLIAIGKNNSEIADILNIADDTVLTYVKGLFRKLDVTSRTQAAVIGYALGLID
jgi:LuxR family quorum-sensing transcriptional regulator LasR